MILGWKYAEWNERSHKQIPSHHCIWFISWNYSTLLHPSEEWTNWRKYASDEHANVAPWFFNIALHLHIQVPSTDMISIFDIFFKVHFVFNIEFEPNLVPAMNFLQYYVYKMPIYGYKPSNRMIDIWNKLQHINYSYIWYLESYQRTSATSNITYTHT